ncbi:hypothetical protein ABTE84_21205, partial [Acinetobacter baumannii]
FPIAAHSICTDAALEPFNEKTNLFKQSGSPDALPVEDATDLRVTGPNMSSDVGLGDSMRRADASRVGCAYSHFRFHHAL